MKILMVTNTYLPIVGGLEKSIQSFTKQFRQMGHEVLIVMPELRGIEDGEKGIVRIPSFREANGTDLSVAMPRFRTLVKTAEEFKPDILHVHHPFLMGEMALRLASHYEKPLVFTYHILFDQYAHYLPLPPAVGKRFLVEVAVGFANLSTRVIAPSESVRELLRAEGVKSPVDVVPTGVEISEFSRGNGDEVRRSLGLSAKDFVLGYVGRIAPEKNLDYLVRMVIDLMKEYENIHFLVIGKGPSEDGIESLFQKEGLIGRLHHLGVVEGRKLTDCYHSMNLFVFASRSETQGMVLCEAMASGVPVVAIDGPGVREVVKDKINGALIDGENDTAFKAAIISYMKSSEERQNKMKSGAKATAKQFSSERCAGRALKVYEQAIVDDSVVSRKQRNEWHRLMRRIGVEWKIVAGFGRAAGLALGEALSPIAMSRKGNDD